MTKIRTFASFLHVGSVVWTCQHGHRVAAVLSGEAVLKPPGHRVVEDVEGKLWNKPNTISKTDIFPLFFTLVVNIRPGL